MRYPTFGFLPIWWIKNSRRAEFWFAFLFWVRLSIFSRAQELSIFHFLWIIHFAYFSVVFEKLFIWGVLPPRSLMWVESIPLSSVLFLLCFFFHEEVFDFCRQIFHLFFYGFWILVHRKIHPSTKLERIFSIFLTSTSMVPF